MIMVNLRKRSKLRVKIQQKRSQVIWWDRQPTNSSYRSYVDTSIIHMNVPLNWDLGSAPTFMKLKLERYSYGSLKIRKKVIQNRNWMDTLSRLLLMLKLIGWNFTNIGLTHILIHQEKRIWRGLSKSWIRREWKILRWSIMGTSETKITKTKKGSNNNLYTYSTIIWSCVIEPHLT